MGAPTRGLSLWSGVSHGPATRLKTASPVANVTEPCRVAALSRWASPGPAPTPAPGRPRRIAGCLPRTAAEGRVPTPRSPTLPVVGRGPRASHASSSDAAVPVRRFLGDATIEAVAAAPSVRRPRRSGSLRWPRAPAGLYSMSVPFATRVEAARKSRPMPAADALCGGASSGRARSQNAACAVPARAPRPRARRACAPRSPGRASRRPPTSARGSRPRALRSRPRHTPPRAVRGGHEEGAGRRAQLGVIGRTAAPRVDSLAAGRPPGNREGQSRPRAASACGQSAAGPLRDRCRPAWSGSGRPSVEEVRGHLAAVLGHPLHHLLVQPDVHARRVARVARVAELAGERPTVREAVVHAEQ